MDPHSFSLLDPDPDLRGTNFQIKTENARKLVPVITASLFKFLK